LFFCGDTQSGVIVMQDDYCLIEVEVRHTAVTLYHVHSGANLCGSRLLHSPSQSKEGVVLRSG